MTSKDKKIVIFDLDDTLYNEIEFLKSAYFEIASKISKELDLNANKVYAEMFNDYINKRNTFKCLTDRYLTAYTIGALLSVYRNHKPKLKFSEDKLKVLKVLKQEGIILGVLTDGRSVQQRNKLSALGISEYFSEIIISEEFGTEKPNKNNFKYFEKIYGRGRYYYIGDNISKDFISPNKLNWVTICLKDKGLNIHSQQIEALSQDYYPKQNINSFYEILDIVL